VPLTIVGIDEAGRGSWAGPLVVASVILKHKIPGLRDSKKLSRSQRDKLIGVILDQALAVGIGLAEADQIDELGLTEAERIAIEASLYGVDSDYSKIIIDGKYNFLAYNPKAVAVVSADRDIYSVSAASIVAKVVRDTIMIENALLYPNYGFEKHVGYGTELHRKQLSLHGISNIHRLSFKPVSLIAQNTF
jgi:ribonuclease HII